MLSLSSKAGLSKKVSPFNLDPLLRDMSLRLAVALERWRVPRRCGRHARATMSIGVLGSAIPGFFGD